MSGQPIYARAYEKVYFVVEPNPNIDGGNVTHTAYVDQMKEAVPANKITENDGVLTVSLEDLVTAGLGDMSIRTTTGTLFKGDVSKKMTSVGRAHEQLLERRTQLTSGRY